MQNKIDHERRSLMKTLIGGLIFAGAATSPAIAAKRQRRKPNPNQKQGQTSGKPKRQRPLPQYPRLRF